MRSLFFPFLLCLLGINSSLLRAQELLQQSVHLDGQELPLVQALDAIATAGDFYFSFNPQQLPPKRVTLPSQEVAVHQAIEHALDQTELTYRVWGEHVLIQPRKKKKIDPITPSLAATPRISFRISGYVRNAQTRVSLALAHLVSTDEGIHTQSDASGRFQFSISAQDSLNIEVYLAGYRPALLQLEVNQDLELGIIELRPIQVDTLTSRILQLEMTEARNPLEELLVVRALVKPSLRATTESNNLTPKLGQFSFIPPLSNHFIYGGQYMNHLSLNLIAGYAGGLSGIEIGGLLNATRHQMSGLQIAGLVNGVGGHARGAQFAGGFNINLGTMRGLQMAGAVNSATDLEGGVQIAGAANFLRHNMIGAQVAAALNLSPGQINGLQLAGFASLNWGQVKGAQISGAFNLAKDIHGLQLAPVNIAHDLAGAQIGVINVAHNVKGIPIGVITLIRHGYHSISFGSDLAWPLQATLRLGVPRFYNIFTYGMRPYQEGWLRGISYGAGSRLTSWEKRMGFRLEATVTTWLSGSPLGTQVQARPLVDWKIMDNLRFLVGPTANLFRAFPAADILIQDSPLPYALWMRETRGRLVSQGWIGIYAGISLERQG